MEPAQLPTGPAGPRAAVPRAWHPGHMPRDPGVSYASDTRQLGRQERLASGRGGGPPGLVVVAIIVVITAIVGYVILR